MAQNESDNRASVHRVVHTPGPWKIHGDGKKHDRYLAVIDSIPDREGKVVANCICHVATSNPDADGNARLIKMAPQMIDDLRLVVDVFGDSKRREPKAEACLLMAIVETIKEATGEVV